MCTQQHISKPRNPIFNQPTVMDMIRSGLQMRRICARATLASLLIREPAINLPHKGNQVRN